MEEKELNDQSLFLYSFNKYMPSKDKVKFIRDFFGYRLSKNDKEYSYDGLLNSLEGVKISKSIFTVPDKHSLKVKNYLKLKGVDFVVKE